MNVHRTKNAGTVDGSQPVSSNRKVLLDQEKALSDSLAQMEFQALTDLTNRAKGGIGIYLGIFLVMCFSTNTHISNPGFVISNTVILVILSILRATHVITCNKFANLQNQKFYANFFELCIMASAIHWGALAAWAVYDPALSDILYLGMIITPSLALAGAMMMNISNRIRIAYPAAMLGIPIITIIAFYDSSESTPLLWLLLFTFFYIIFGSQTSHNDYWASLKNYHIAQKRSEEMARLSITDQLTQLYNRLHFDNQFDLEWKNAKRQNQPLSLLIVDVDHFKKLNDAYGHMFGDKCLKKIANTISSTIKRPKDIAARTFTENHSNTDFVARYGGEEFVVLLPNTDKSGAKFIAERIRRAIEKIDISYDDKTIKLTASIGGATFTSEDDNKEKQIIIKIADDNLYVAKNQGRNCSIL